MSTVTLKDLQRDPAVWLDRVAAGEQVIVARDGHPVAVLGPVRPAERDAAESPRPAGLAAGAFAVPEDFDAPLPEDVLRTFVER